MKTKLSPRQSALHLLDMAIANFHKEPGDPLPIMSMASMWDSVQSEVDGFGAGINYALSRGWVIVEKGPFLPYVKLTSAGYHRKHHLRNADFVRSHALRGH